MSTLLLTLVSIKTSLGQSLIVTHATQGFDPKSVTAPGLIQVVHDFRTQGLPVVFLYGRETYQSPLSAFKPLVPWLPSDHLVESQNGEFTAPSEVILAQHASSKNEITLAGGYLSLCLNRTLKNTVEQLSGPSFAPLEITLALEAIYLEEPFARVTLSNLGCAPQVVIPNGVFTLANLKRWVNQPRCFARFLKQVLAPEFDPQKHRVKLTPLSGRTLLTFGQGQTKIKIKY